MRVRLGAAGDVEATDDVSVAAMYQRDVRELLTWVVSAAQRLGGGASRDQVMARVADAQEAASSWFSFNWAQSAAAFERWRAEGERLIAELTSIRKELSGERSGDGIGVALLGVLALVAAFGVRS